MSSSSTSDASSSEDEWEEAEIAVNQKITNDDNTNNELQPSPDSVVVGTDVIETMKRKRDERDEKRKKKKKKRYIIPGSHEDQATLHQVQLLFNLGRLRRENNVCNNNGLQRGCLSYLPADFLNDLFELKNYRNNSSNNENNNNIKAQRDISVNQLQKIVTKYNKIMTYQTLPHPPGAPSISMDRLMLVCRNKKGTSYELHLLLCSILRAFNIPTRIVGVINPISWRNNNRSGRKKTNKKSKNKKRRKNNDGASSNGGGSSSHNNHSNSNSSSSSSSSSKKIKMSNAVSSNITRELLLTTTSSSKAYVPSTWLEVYAIANGDATQPHLQAEMNRKSGNNTKKKTNSSARKKKNNSSKKLDNHEEEDDLSVQHIKKRWVHLDCIRNVIDQPSSVEWLRPKNEDLIYTFAIDRNDNVIDVLDRYSFKPSVARKKQFPDNKKFPYQFWLKSLLQQLTSGYDGNTKESREEKKELSLLGNSEQIPTSQNEFRNHPLYALESHLAKNEVIYNGTVTGYFKGNPVYRRENVKQVRSVEQWKRMCREVKEDQLNNPTKVGSKRIRNVKNDNNNMMMNMNNSSSDEDANGNTGSSSSKKKSNMERIPLFGLWQTTLYKPPPVVNGKIPRNSYGNWELWTRGHTPAGSVHLAHDKIETTCKALGVEYVAVVNGFERKQGRTIPVKNGVLVLKEMEGTIIEAHEAMEIEREKKRALKRKKRAIRNWRRLMSCYKTKMYVDEMYNYSSSDEDTTNNNNQNAIVQTKKNGSGSNSGKSSSSSTNGTSGKSTSLSKNNTELIRNHAHQFDIKVRLDNGCDQEKCSICGFVRVVEEM